MSNILSWLSLVFYGISTTYFLAIFFLKKDRTRTLAFLFLLLGLFTHGLDILVFALDHNRFPASNFIEAFSLFTFLAMLLFVVLVRKPEMVAAGMILLPVTLISVVLTGLLRDDQNVQPILQAGWIYIHIPLMILSVAALAISFAMAVLYLLQEKQLKSKTPAFFYHRLPSLEVCEDLSYKSLWFGFFLLTIGICTGMIWSKHLHGVYWSWDTKEIGALLTWILYAILIHGRMLSSWRGKKAAYLSIIGFALIFFTFAGISLISKGYHSF